MVLFVSQNDNHYLTYKNCLCSTLNPLPQDNVSSLLFCAQSDADDTVYVDALSFVLSFSFTKGGKSATLTLYSSPDTYIQILTPLNGSLFVHCTELKEVVEQDANIDKKQ